jgi:UDP-MurNAc hydroxylase
MRLQYIASACVLIEHRGVKVLCDPWLVDGAYGGAWYHNPPLSVTPEDFADIDAIYLSHIHPDHACFSTLARLPRVPVLLGRYAETFFGDRLRTMGFPLLIGSHEIGPDFFAWVIPADDCNPEACGRWIGCEIKNPNAHHSYQIDTFAVFQGGGKVIVNTNDCPYELSTGVLGKIKHLGAPELLCVGYAGAGPWPQCFDMPMGEKLTAAANKKQQFLGQMRAFVDHLQPKRYLPFAGQYTLGGSLVDLNDLRGVPELDELPDDPCMVRLNRNAWFDCDTGEASDPWTVTDRAELIRYRGTLRRKALDHEADPWPGPGELCDLFGEAMESWRRRCNARGIVADGVVEFRVANQEERHVTALRPSHHTTVITADARLWRRILTRQFNMNNAEVGSLLTFRRDGPYDRALMNSLSYFHV